MSSEESNTRELEFLFTVRTVTSGRWEELRWELFDTANLPVDTNEDEKSFKIQLPVTLHPDESSDYQFNLSSNAPKVFVICARDEVDDVLEPQSATLCQDEAVSYMEGEQEVFSVALRPSLIPWVEDFVKRYPPRPTHKRKRK
jgi:hypothetical protein